VGYASALLCPCNYTAALLGFVRFGGSCTRKEEAFCLPGKKKKKSDLSVMASRPLTLAGEPLFVVFFPPFASSHDDRPSDRGER
jgi:hypothetical protein